MPARAITQNMPEPVALPAFSRYRVEQNSIYRNRHFNIFGKAIIGLPVLSIAYGRGAAASGLATGRVTVAWQTPDKPALRRKPSVSSYFPGEKSIMLFPETLCVVRGGGDLATGVIYRLHRAGFPVIALELPQPRVVRRMASVAQALFDGQVQIEQLRARRATAADAFRTLGSVIPVIADPQADALADLRPAVVVDARMAKVPLDTTPQAARLVVGLGPGLIAGLHCHAVVETQRGHDLGRVIWKGPAQANTGEPEQVMGYRSERVLRAPEAGQLRATAQIGDLVRRGDTLASVNEALITAPFDGMLRGLLFDGIEVHSGEKIGDIDPRGQRRYCFSISDKSLAVGGGALEAVLTWLQGS